MTNFEELRRVNVARCQRWHPGFPDDETWMLSDWACAMAGEAGEALNVVKKLRRIDLGTLPPSTISRESDRTNLLANLGEELADTVIYADLLAAKAHIDLARWVRVKFNGVSIREGWPERLGSESRDDSRSRAIEAAFQGIPPQYVESESLRRKIAEGCVDDALAAITAPAHWGNDGEEEPLEYPDNLPHPED